VPRLNAKKIELYRIKIDNKNYDFEFVDEWNGIIELKHEDGTILALPLAPGDRSLFENLTFSGRKIGEYDLQIVKISPNLYDKIKGESN
jgi:hypothetical protein